MITLWQQELSNFPAVQCKKAAGNNNDIAVIAT